MKQIHPLADCAKVRDRFGVPLTPTCAAGNHFKIICRKCHNTISQCASSCHATKQIEKVLCSYCKRRPDEEDEELQEDGIPYSPWTDDPTPEEEDDIE